MFGSLRCGGLDRARENSAIAFDAARNAGDQRRKPIPP